MKFTIDALKDFVGFADQYSEQISLAKPVSLFPDYEYSIVTADQPIPLCFSRNKGGCVSSTNIGSLLMYKGNHAERDKNAHWNTRIVSQNVSFDSFDSEQLDKLENFIYNQFYYNVAAVLLQDFPYSYVSRLAELGHVACVCYGLGKNGDLIANVQVFNPLFITTRDFEKAIFSYLPEVEKTLDTFIAGTFIAEFPTLSLTIGSHYESYFSTLSLRRKNARKRFDYLNSTHLEITNRTIIMGDFNPRTLSRLTDEKTKWKTGIQKLDRFIYLARLVPFVVLSMFGVNPRKELDSYTDYGVIYPEKATKTSIKMFGIVILDTQKLGWVIDACQTLISKDEMEIYTMDENGVSDHHPIYFYIVD